MKIDQLCFWKLLHQCFLWCAVGFFQLWDKFYEEMGFWMCDLVLWRFLAKGGVAQPAICEVPLPGGGACGSSSSRQAITPHHHSSQIHSEFRNSTKQESAIISQTESSVDTKIKAQRNMASNPSGPHLECNLSAAGGLVLGTLDSSVRQSSVHEGDGYSVDFPNKQSTILDDTAVMSAVRTWRTETGKYRENVSQSCSGKWGGAAPRCCFCGLPGHSVANCSETLDCELRELEKWAVEGVKMWVGGDILCLRCLGIGHWGAQCHLSVIEAASKAHEKAEFWRVNKTNWTGSCREEEEEQTKTVNRSCDVHDYTSQDTEGVMCYNCNEMGHWARYCPRHRGSSDGRAQSSGKGKGHQISNSSGGKVRTSLGQGKLEAYVQLPSLVKPTQSAQARYCSHIITALNRRPLFRDYKLWGLVGNPCIQPTIPSGEDFILQTYPVDNKLFSF